MMAEKRTGSPNKGDGAFGPNSKRVKGSDMKSEVGMTQYADPDTGKETSAEDKKASANSTPKLDAVVTSEDAGKTESKIIEGTEIPEKGCETENNSSAGDPSTLKYNTVPGDPRHHVSADSVIAHFAPVSGEIVLAREHNNARTHNKQVQAYAKLAGRGWTFYVQKLEIVIGRSVAEVPGAVDIDLCPSKVVSRRHATIKYNMTSRQWEILTHGRNGLRVDGFFLRAGFTAALRSGNIVDVGNVQMMFVLPDAEPVIAPDYLFKTLEIIQKERALNPALTAQPEPEPKSSKSTDNLSKRNMPNNKGELKRAFPRNPPTYISSGDQDLGTDSCKNIKPPYSYATMISQAILSSPDEMMTLADIYAWISSTYAFYRYQRPGWQNSIRHNLSLNKAFEKVARKENEPGKGSKWHIVEKYKAEFIKKAITGRDHYKPQRRIREYVQEINSASGGGSTSNGSDNSNVNNGGNTNGTINTGNTGGESFQNIQHVPNSHVNPESQSPNQLMGHDQPQPQPLASHMITSQPLPGNNSASAASDTGTPKRSNAPSADSTPSSLSTSLHPQHFDPKMMLANPANYGMTLSYQNMPPNFPMQPYQYMSPYGMGVPYYQSHPSQPMVGMMPISPQHPFPIPIPGIRMQPKPEDYTLEGNGRLSPTPRSNQASPRLPGVVPNLQASSLNENNEVNSSQPILRPSGGQQSTLADGDDGNYDKTKREQFDKSAKLDEMQTPARSRGGHHLFAETPVLGSAIKLPAPSSAGLESSPVIWKYMNLESTPVSEQKPDLNPRKPGPTSSSSPPDDIPHVAEPIPVLKTWEDSKA